MPEISQSTKDFTSRDWKQQAVLQWQNDPCGLLDELTDKTATVDFFEAIDRNRYDEHAPWLREAAGFDGFTGRKVLEVGFGMGTDLFQIARSGAEVHGVDLVPKHLEIATKRFEVFGIPAELQIADAENLPFDDNSFDSVYTFGVIHHTPDTQKAVDEIHRVLKPGGNAVIGVYHKNSAYYLFDVVLTQYILMRQFLRESFAETVSRIESRKKSDAIPLVKVYSRLQFGHLLRAFETVKIDSYHIERSHFGVLRRFVGGEMPNRRSARLGWYLLAHCKKKKAKP